MPGGQWAREARGQGAPSRTDARPARPWACNGHPLRSPRSGGSALRRDADSMNSEDAGSIVRDDRCRDRQRPELQESHWGAGLRRTRARAPACTTIKSSEKLFLCSDRRIAIFCFLVHGPWSAAVSRSYSIPLVTDRLRRGEGWLRGQSSLEIAPRWVSLQQHVAAQSVAGLGGGGILEGGVGQRGDVNVKVWLMWPRAGHLNHKSS